MKRDVLVRRTVAALAGHAQKKTVAPILIHCSGNVVDPRVVALQALRSRGPGIISRRTRIQETRAPCVRAGEPDDRQLEEPVTMPGKIDFIRHSLGAVHEGDWRNRPFFLFRSHPDRCHEIFPVGLLHFEPQATVWRRMARRP
jgi:hypothetical protein